MNILRDTFQLWKEFAQACVKHERSAILAFDLKFLTKNLCYIVIPNYISFRLIKKPVLSETILVFVLSADFKIEVGGGGGTLKL